MITRRTLLGTAMAATATGLYAPRVRAAEPDTLRFANSAGGPRKLDPNQITQGADSWAAAQVFEYLAQPADGDFGKTPDEFEPWLAESWTTSDDARTWVFTLRQGVQFHGGYGEMTSEDVARSFIRARDEGVDSSNYENIVSAEPSGKYEVTVTLKNPDPLFLGSTVFTRRTMIISKSLARPSRPRPWAQAPMSWNGSTASRASSSAGSRITGASLRILPRSNASISPTRQRGRWR